MVFHHNVPQNYSKLYQTEEFGEIYQTFCVVGVVRYATRDMQGQIKICAIKAQCTTPARLPIENRSGRPALHNSNVQWTILVMKFNLVAAWTLVTSYL